jgi:hypothetical protein
MMITAAYKNPCSGYHDRLGRPCKGFRTLSKAKAKLTRVLAIAAVFGAVIADDVRADTPGLSYAFGSELPFVAGSAVVPLRAGGLALGDFNGDGKVDPYERDGQLGQRRPVAGCRGGRGLQRRWV